jgi:hypothetical protein
MEEWKIFLIVAVGLMVPAAVYLVVHRLLLSHERISGNELMKSSRTLTLTMRLQAYERLILLLERISPEALLMKVKSRAATNSDLHLAMLQQIRVEYEHNLAQQLYVSDRIWELVREAREKTALWITDLAKNTKPDSPSVELAKLLLDKLMDDGETPAASAITEVKYEARKLF